MARISRCYIFDAGYDPPPLTLRHSPGCLDTRTSGEPRNLDSAQVVSAASRGPHELTPLATAAHDMKLPLVTAQVTFSGARNTAPLIRERRPAAAAAPRSPVPRGLTDKPHAAQLTESAEHTRESRSADSVAARRREPRSATARVSPKAPPRIRRLTGTARDNAPRRSGLTIDRYTSQVVLDVEAHREHHGDAIALGESLPTRWRDIAYGQVELVDARSARPATAPSNGFSPSGRWITEWGRRHLWGARVAEGL
jgi:hypothetical protein